MLSEHIFEVALSELVGCGSSNFESKRLEDHKFALFDLLSGDFLVGDLLVYSAEEERVDVLILGSHEHASNASNVQLGELEGFALLNQSSKISVHEGDGQEKSLFSALEGSHNFDHPVDHLGPVNSSDFVTLKQLFW